MVKLWLHNLFVTIDQFLNAITFGDPDETLSSRWSKLRKHCRFCRFMCKLLHRIDPGHCDRVVELDEGKDAIR